jgi:DNA polymerase-3 subunit delta
MYKRELDGLIASGNLPKSLLLYGEDFSASTYAKFIANKLGEKENILSFYFEEYQYESAKNYISQPSLFGDINILYIKGNRKIPKKELDTLVGFCEKNAHSFFIYEFSGEDRVAKELSRSFSKKRKADFVRFFKPNLSEAVAILAKRAAKIGLEIENYALQHLFMVQNEDIALAVNELEKLLLLDKKVEIQDIDAHVYGMGMMSMDSFIENFLKGADIREDLKQLLESGSADEIRIVNAMQAYIVQLMMFRTYITVHGRYDVMEIVGFPLPAALVKMRAAQSTKIRLETYQEMLTELLDAEFKLKTYTNLDKNSFLFSTLIKLQTSLQ